MDHFKIGAERVSLFPEDKNGGLGKKDKGWGHSGAGLLLQGAVGVAESLGRRELWEQGGSTLDAPFLLTRVSLPPSLSLSLGSEGL